MIYKVDPFFFFLVKKISRQQNIQIDILIMSHMILLCLFNSKISQKKRGEVDVKLIIKLERPYVLISLLIKIYLIKCLNLLILYQDLCILHYVIDPIIKCNTFPASYFHKVISF